MNLNELLKAAEKIPSLLMAVASSGLLNRTFLTGSRAFGTNKPGSDFDLVVSIIDFDDVKTVLSELAPGAVVTPSDYFAGVKYKWMDTRTCPKNPFDDLEINLIPLHPNAFQSWYLATLAMAASCREAAFTNPVYKYSVFEAMVAAFKSATYASKTAGTEDGVDIAAICRSAANQACLQPGINDLLRRLGDVRCAIDRA